MSETASCSRWNLDYYSRIYLVSELETPSEFLIHLRRCVHCAPSFHDGDAGTTCEEKEEDEHNNII
jgi:hypothetical protein